MKPTLVWIIAIAVVGAAAGGIGYWLGHRGASTATEEKSSEAGGEGSAATVAPVTVVPLRKETLTADVTAYGSVVSPASETSVISVPFESQIKKISVAPGEAISAGQVLAEVEPSAATLLAFEEAQNAQAAAERDLQAVKQRYDQKLATNADLYTAENNLRTAQGRLKSLQQAGAGGAAPLKANAAGIVSKIDVQNGQVVPIGGPLLEIATQNQIEVHLGLEAGDAQSLAVGNPVQIQSLNDSDAKPIAGKIRLIGRQIDSATRLMDVWVSLPPDAQLALQSFVVATIPRAIPDAWVVPRDAALPDEAGAYTLFTVKDGKAVKHSVHLGVENDREVQLIADDLHEGDSVVVAGNLELDDGMSVQAQPEETQPTTTQPAQNQSEPSEAKP